MKNIIASFGFMIISIYILITGRWAWGTIILHGTERYLVAASLFLFGTWIMYLVIKKKIRKNKGN